MPTGPCAMLATAATVQHQNSARKMCNKSIVQDQEDNLPVYNSKFSKNLGFITHSFNNYLFSFD